jgi:hypothetical protein
MWLPLLLLIREVPGSNPDPEIGYPDRFFVVSPVPPGECQDIILKLGNDRFLTNHFQFIINL